MWRFDCSSAPTRGRSHGGVSKPLVSPTPSQGVDLDLPGTLIQTRKNPRVWVRWGRLCCVCHLLCFCVFGVFFVEDEKEQTSAGLVLIV